MHIHLIEDDGKLRGELVKLLEREGYRCTFEEEFEDTARRALAAGADLILLDVNLPGEDGYGVCREIRRHSDVPVLVVTSRSTELDELMSMQLGADDFIVKPYHPQILLAHIAAVLKRAGKPDADRAQYKGVTLHAAQGRAAYAGLETELTKNEQKILSYLLRHAGRIVSRDELMQALWQSDVFVDDNTLTVNVNRLRRKLEEIGAADFITTKRGQGYQI